MNEFICGIGVGVLIGFGAALWRWVKPLEDKLAQQAGGRKEGEK